MGVFLCDRFFLQEIQAGEALISSGDIEQGVTHLANAVVVCGQPTQLLQVSVSVVCSDMTYIHISLNRLTFTPSKKNEYRLNENIISLLFVIVFFS